MVPGFSVSERICKRAGGRQGEPENQHCAHEIHRVSNSISTSYRHCTVHSKLSLAAALAPNKFNNFSDWALICPGLGMKSEELAFLGEMEKEMPRIERLKNSGAIHK